jgi:hypothetical protein
MNRSITPRVAVIIILCAILIVAGVEIQALKSSERRGTHEMAVTAANCLKCHSDAKMIKRMWLKEDGVGPLFNTDGTFRDPNAPALIAKYQREAQGGTAYKYK